MKATTFFSLLLFACSAFASSQSKPDLSCRAYKPAPNVGPEALIAYDLTHGLWVPEEASTTTIQFNEDGTAVRFNGTGDNVTASFMLWSVSTVEGLIQLSTLHSEDGSLQQYVVTTDCDGVNLLNTATWELSRLYYRPLAASSRLREMMADLRGEWTAYASQPRHGEPHAVRMTFDENQQYARLLDMGTTEMPERGVWELSKDGNYLLLHACRRNQPTVCDKTTVYRLVYCDDHSLQLRPVSISRKNEKEQQQQPNGLLSFIK